VDRPYQAHQHGRRPSRASVLRSSGDTRRTRRQANDACGGRCRAAVGLPPLPQDGRCPFASQSAVRPVRVGFAASRSSGSAPHGLGALSAILSVYGLSRLVEALGSTMRSRAWLAFSLALACTSPRYSAAGVEVAHVVRHPRPGAQWRRAAGVIHVPVRNRSRRPRGFLVSLLRRMVLTRGTGGCLRSKQARIRRHRPD
jgi:hypothetical protein